MNEHAPKTKIETNKSRKPNLWRRFRRWLSRTWQRIHPSPRVRKGAAIGIIALIVLLAIMSGMYIRPGFPGVLDILAGTFILLVMATLAGLLVGLILKILSVLPRFLTFVGLIALVVFFIFLELFAFPNILLIGLVIGLAEAVLGGSLASLFSKRFGRASWAKKASVLAAIVITVALNIYLIYWFVDRGSDKHLVVKKADPVHVEPLDMSDPSQPGHFEVMSLTYGSGTDKRRPEFGKEAKLKTEPVDATPFVKGSKRWKMKLRKWFWGFDFEKFPRNGRVWYPAGEGPFPLVLCVHGNHNMAEFSDPGYAYLGEHLASRGFIFISVDENFFNGHFLGGLKTENDGRGWMLLQHLKVWQEWNNSETNPFFGKVDMNNIGLIGHSRGGEAAAIAGSFNCLSLYPDDATVEFDFGFNIKAIVAIAPSDGQYRPAGRPTPLENVNYLTIQGAHDADVSSFTGARQYNRVKFTDGKYWFKAYIYSYRSNHGQFNTVWGDNDWGRPWGMILNRKSLLTGEDQRKISRVYITAFLESTLHGKTGYIPLFRDQRCISAWLPEDIYINRFEDSTFRVLNNFDEDVDVTTATLKGASIQGENLAVWREANLGFRNRGTKDNNVVFIGWREPESEEHESEESKIDISIYSIELPDDAQDEFNLTRDSLLVFSLAEADEKPPKSEDKDKHKEDEDEKAAEKEAKKEAEEEAEKEADKKDEEEKDREPIDLSVELVAADGQAAKLPLSHFMAVPPIIKSRFTKFRKENKIYGKAYEPTLQVYELHLAAFIEENPDFDPTFLKTIRFVFDQNSKGVIILDNIGFAEPLVPSVSKGR